MKTKLLLISFIIAFTGLSAQKSLSSFDHLMGALKGGKTVKAVFDYKKCQLISGNEIKEKVPDAIGGFTLDVFEYFAEGAVHNKQAFVVASVSKLIQNPIGEGYVYNYVKIKVSADNKVKITAVYVDAKTQEEIMSENFFTTISNGKDDAGAHFFSN